VPSAEGDQPVGVWVVRGRRGSRLNGWTRPCVTLASSSSSSLATAADHTASASHHGGMSIKSIRYRHQSPHYKVDTGDASAFDYVLHSA